MPPLILIALDGSEKDDRAIAAALAVAKLSRGDLHLVRVVSDPLAGVARDPQRDNVGLRSAQQVADVVAEDRSAAESQLSTVATSLPLLDGQKATWTVLQARDIAAAIIDHARVHEALLIVLATRAPSTRSRAIAGSVADHVMRESPRPVILVPPGAAFLAGKQPTIARVLVPLDDSSLSLRSLEFLIDLPRASEVEYVLVAVVPHERQRATAEERLGKTASWLRSRGVTQVEVLVPVSTDVAAAIMASLRTALADALVMSTRGAGGLGRLILGSVAEQVVRKSELPVMLLTPRMLAQT